MVDVIISEASLFFDLFSLKISQSTQSSRLAIFPSFFGHSFSYLLDYYLFYSDSSTKYMQWWAVLSRIYGSFPMFDRWKYKKSNVNKEEGNKSFNGFLERPFTFLTLMYRGFNSDMVYVDMKVSFEIAYVMLSRSHSFSRFHAFIIKHLYVFPSNEPLWKWRGES